MNSQQAYSQQVYEILKDFLPQIEREIREELELKYRKIYEQRCQLLARQHEEETVRKYNDQIVKAIKEKQMQIKLDYERLLQEKIREIENNNEEALRRFKKQVRDKRIQEGAKDQQIAVLQQQKTNWQKLEKQYQKALRQLSIPDENRLKTPHVSRISNSKEKSGSLLIQPCSHEHPKHTSKSSNTSTTLRIGIPREKKLDIEADMSRYADFQISDLFRKDDNTSDYSSLLSPPHIEAYQLQRKRVPPQPREVPPSQKKKSMFWNEQKKKQLLDMIRKRIV